MSIEEGLIDGILAQWAASPEADWLCPGVLRRARRVPVMAAAMDPVLTDPVSRALAGLDAAPDTGGLSTEDALWAAISRHDGGESVPVDEARPLSEALQDHPTLSVPALRLWIQADESRERKARAALSEQDLPYVFPGELHPLSIELLASADRVMTALHVDWMRKLTTWASDALRADARALGFWFWPHLPFLDERKLATPLRRLSRIRRAPPGARGLAFAYMHRIGLDVGPGLKLAEPADAFVAAVAIASDRSGGTAS